MDKLRPTLLLTILLLPQAKGQVLPGPVYALGSSAVTPPLASLNSQAAVTPHGKVFLAYLGASNQAFTNAIRYTVVNVSGVVDRPPTIISGPPVVAPLHRIAASPTGFIISWPVSGPAQLVYQVYDLGGNQIGSAPVPANAQPIGQILAHGASGDDDGSFLLVWITATLSGSPSQGVWVRRISASGVPLGATETRVDNPSAGFGVQQNPSVSSWPSGRVVVVWQDGPNSSQPSTFSPDGSGTAVLGRWLEASLAPVGPTYVVCNLTLAGHQYAPLVAADDRDSCIVAWRDTSVPERIDVKASRFDNSGNRIYATDLGVSTTVLWPANHLTSLSIAANGEWVAGFGPIGAAPPGNPLPPPIPAGAVAASWWSRRTPEGVQVESGNPEPPAPSGTPSVRSPVVSMDQYGNFACAYEVLGGPTGSFATRWRRYSRNMISFSDATPARGSTMSITLRSDCDPYRFYVMAASLGLGPIGVDRRALGLSPDNLFFTSIGADDAVFQRFAAYLDGTGGSSLSAVAIPDLPQVAGATVFFAFVTLEVGAPSSIQTISPSAAITIE